MHLGSFENLGGYYLVIDSLFLFLVPFLFIQNVEGSKDCSPSVLPSLAHKGLNLPKSSQTYTSQTIAGLKMKSDFHT